MAGSRTIKTLTALLIAMTIGSFLLMLLASEPISSSPVPGLLTPTSGDDTLKAIQGTKYPLRQNWQMVVVHSSNAEPADIAKRCHFIIDANGTLSRTDLWSRQMDGNHVYIYGADWNSVSIGVLVISDPSKKHLQAQSDSLEKLIDGLRQTCKIPEAKIYRHAQLQDSPPGCGMFN
jgi:hypothetical protein